jgi:trimeric autotransporter adhesin
MFTKRFCTTLALAGGFFLAIADVGAQSYIIPSTPGWTSVSETPTGSTAFVSGPGVPPSGSPGSLQITVGNPGGQYFFTQQYSGVRLDQIAGFSYNTYVVSSAISETANLQFDFDPGVVPPNYTGYQGRAVFVPSLLAGAVQVGTWQSWNPMTQRAWIGSGSAGTRVLAALCTQASPCTWAQILAAFPNSRVLANSSLGFKVGNSFNAAVVSIDSFAIGTAGAAGPINRFNFAIAPPPPPPPPPPPTAPTNLVCTSTGFADINCRYSLSTTTSANPIQTYRLYCANDTVNVAYQTTVAATETTASIGNAAFGRYTCNVTAQSTTSASDLSNLARLVLQRTPLSLSGQFSPDGTGFGAILVRNNSVPLVSAIGRFDGTKFNFTPTNDLGSQSSTLGIGDLVGRNRSGVISRNLIGDVRVDTDTAFLPVSATLRKAQQDWALESVIDLDGDGRADLVWRYMKPGSNDSGVIFAWFSTGNDAASANVGEVVFRGGAPLTWSLIGAIDLGGDGKGDLIWLSPTNEIRSLTSSTSRRTWLNERIGMAPSGYSIQKLSDFNADGKGDILFKDSAGRVKLWLMDGTRIVADVDMPGVAASTTFFAAGDFDGDGTIDIVWRRADGTLTVWLMNKSVINQPTVIENVGQAPAGVVVE